MSAITEIHMSEEDLELLITLDDPGDPQEEDAFHHLQAENTLEYWLGQPFPARGRHDQRAEAVSHNDAYKAAFGQGDSACTSSRLTGTTNDRCSHLSEISNVTPKTPNGCEECLKMGDRWVHLRLCATCGHIGCCDDSKNKHATKHFHSTNHPLIKSFEPGEDWGWCYIDELFFEQFPGSLTSQCDALGVTLEKTPETSLHKKMPKWRASGINAPH